MSYACTTLIVDDDPDVCRTLGNILTAAGHIVEAVHRGADAIALTSTRTFDVITLDLHLPDIPGMDVLARLEAQTAETDILIITGHASLDNAMRAVQRSTIGYLTKPFDVDRLLQIFTLIGRRRALAAENSRLASDIRNAKMEWEATVDAITDPIALAGEGGELLRINGALCRALSASFAEVLGQADTSILFRNNPAQGAALRERALRDNSAVTLEIDDLTIEGVFLVSCFPAAFEDNRRVVYVLKDVTDVREAQDELHRKELELLHAQKLEAVGRLATGVAHDSNNALTVISGHAGLALARTDLDEPLREALEAIRKAARRSAELTKHLLAFARKQVFRPAVIDPNELMKGMDTFLRPLISANITLETQLAATVPRVLVDSSQIEQVITNLVVNAVDAIGEKGSIEIRTRATSGENEPKDLQLAPVAHAVIEVHDDGEGIDPETIPQIFDPFFTTKEIGQGTGLGLSSASGIVSQAGGRLSVESERGVGTVFRVYLPQHEGVTPLGITESHREAEPAEASPATILVVDDDRTVGLVIQLTLENHGHTVLLARDGAGALERLTGAETKPDLLISDVVMPGLNGVELAEQLTSADPDLRILFVTGYTARPIPPRYEVLPKPFTPRVLLNQVNRLLAARDARSGDS